jgi:hypothetical protein
MTSSICNTSRQILFFSHDSTRPILDMRRWASQPLCKTHTQVTNQHDTYRQQTKTKVSSKDIHEEWTSKHHCDPANNRHAKTWVEIYSGLRHYAQVSASQGDKHYHKTIFTTMMFLMGRVWQWDKIIVDSQGLKEVIFEVLYCVKNSPFTDHKNVTL